MDTQHAPKSGQSVTGRIKGYIRNHPLLWVVLYLGCILMAFPLVFAAVLLVEHFIPSEIFLNPFRALALILPVCALPVLSLIYLRYLIWPKTFGGPFGQSTLEEHAKRHNVPDTDMKKFLRMFIGLIVIVELVLWLI